MYLYLIWFCLSQNISLAKSILLFYLKCLENSTETPLTSVSTETDVSCSVNSSVIQHLITVENLYWNYIEQMKTNVYTTKYSLRNHNNWMSYYSNWIDHQSHDQSRVVILQKCFTKPLQFYLCFCQINDYLYKRWVIQLEHWDKSEKLYYI